MRFKLALAVLLALASPLAGHELTTAYTSLQNCARITSLPLVQRTVEEGSATGIRQCDGPAGFSLYVVDEDPRSFLVLNDGERIYSLEQEMAADFHLGHFPNVAGTKLAEWQLNRQGRPAALIIRVQYLHAENASPASTLMVFDLRQMPPALLGTSTSNREARAIARR